MLEQCLHSCSRGNLLKVRQHAGRAAIKLTAMYLFKVRQCQRGCSPGKDDKKYLIVRGDKRLLLNLLVIIITSGFLLAMKENARDSVVGEIKEPFLHARLCCVPCVELNAHP